MRRILLAGFKQETSTFNPTPTAYDVFEIYRGQAIVDHLSGTDTEIAGILDVLQPAGIEPVPTMVADSVSGGPVPAADLDRLCSEILAAVDAKGPYDGACLVFHGAMAGTDEPDPEGYLLSQIRSRLGSLPIVVTLDLHAVFTDRLQQQGAVFVPFHTYPHTDQYQTGQRAAQLLLKLLDQSVKPTTARVELPMLVRGDELLTASGKFGQLINRCQQIEADPKGLAAGILIGNPFTDVPALQSNVLVTTDDNPQLARELAEDLARQMWHNRHRFVAPLKSISEALAIAAATEGLTVFSDAADATASGAPGDSNAILKGMVESAYEGKALISLVDAPGVDAAFDAGVGARLNLPLGGSLDPQRHSPLNLEVYVKALTDGDFVYENGTAGRGGRTAVLVAGNMHLLVTEQSIYIVGRRVYQSHGLEPTDFDVVVCKSPNGFRTHYQAIAAAIVPVDAPGATSANLQSLPYQHCIRPIFPLEKGIEPPFAVHDF